mgnify:CR=1 FL=1
MLTFDADKHIYRWNGQVVPSVTEIIGAWLPVKGADFYVNTFTGAIVYADKFEAAGKVGKAIHKACGYIANGQGVDMEAIDRALIPPLKQFKKWMGDFKAKPIAVETPMYSVKYEFAGTPDIVCELSQDKNILVVVDIKTGLVNDMAGVQTSGYEILAREDLKIRKIIKRYELILPRDGSQYKFKQLTDKDDFTFFLSRLNQYNYLKNRR